MDEEFEILERALLNLIASDEEEEKSEFESLYKNWGKLGSQEERRAQLLESQKRNRNNKVDKFRGILDLVRSVEESNKLFKPYENVDYKPSIYIPGFHKTCLTYSKVLMLSEWMVEKPSDFAQNWYVVPCPKAMRVLAIANNGSTKFYSKHGHFKFERFTGLPGGSPYTCVKRNCCVLDCFYYELNKTLYILDLLAWNNQPMTDGETEFRQYWMKIQIEDLPNTKTVNSKNQLVIKILPMMQCSQHYISYFLSTYPHFENNTPPLDGLLFYHKKAHYIAGQTPLVGWLYPYMIPEILGNDITIHPGYLAEMPVDYVNQADFIQKFELRYSKKGKGSNHMETEISLDNNKNETQQNTSCMKSENITSMEADVEEKSVGPKKFEFNKPGIFF